MSETPAIRIPPRWRRHGRRKPALGRLQKRRVVGRHCGPRDPPTQFFDRFGDEHRNAFHARRDRARRRGQT